jgi:hypothetical protein
MDQSTLAHALRQWYQALGHVPAADIASLSDEEMIDFFLTCPSCHDTHLPPEQLQAAMSGATNLHEFLRLYEDFDDANHRQAHQAPPEAEASMPDTPPDRPDTPPAPPWSDEPNDAAALLALIEALVGTARGWRRGKALDRARLIRDLGRFVTDLQYGLNQEVQGRDRKMMEAIDRAFEPLVRATDREQVQALEREVAELGEHRARRDLDRPQAAPPPTEAE